MWQSLGRRRPDPGSERGSATAEFAVVVPAVLLVLALALAGVQAAALQVRLQDAAADAARAFARGDSTAVTAARVARQVPGAAIATRTDGDLICAELRASAGAVIGALGITVRADSCAVSGGG